MYVKKKGKVFSRKKQKKNAGYRTIFFVKVKFPELLQQNRTYGTQISL